MYHIELNSINEAPSSTIKSEKMTTKEEEETQEKGRDSETTSLLINPSLLQRVTPKQRLGAITSAEVATRAKKCAKENVLA